MLRFLLLFIASTVFPLALYARAANDNTQPAPLDAKAAGTLFTISGSNTIGAKLAPEWAKRYLELKGASAVSISPGKRENEYLVTGINDEKIAAINVKAHGSSTGFKDLAQKATHIAMSSRPIKLKENQLFKTVDMRDFTMEQVVAIDGLAIIVNPANPIAQLTTDEVAQIFSGKIKNWKALGGADQSINIYARDNKSGTWDTFKSLVLGKKYSLSPQAERLESNDELSSLISDDSSGIGFVGLASVLNAKAISISSGAARALPPVPIFVATEDYPLSRRLFMYINNADNPYVQEFLRFVQSDIGQQSVVEVGFVSQKPSSEKISVVEGPKGYRDLVQHGERLSINFRFNEGSAALDNKAKRDIERLASYLKTETNKGKIVQLVGFGDRKFSESRSIVLSKLRAMAVKVALRKQDVETQDVLGFGDSVPVASQYGDYKQKNSRVEVWLFEAKHRAKLDQIKKDASLGKRQVSTAIHIVTD